MAEQAPTTGTTGQEGGDAAAHTQTTGTPDTADRNAESQIATKEELLAWKAKAEEANRIIAEREAELRERLAQSPAAPDAEPGDDGDDIDWDQVRYHAKQGDSVAKLQLKNYRENEELRAELRETQSGIRLLRELDAIKDPEEQEAVREHFKKNRHRLADIKAAKAEVREIKLESEVSELRKKLELAAKKPPGGPPTGEREIPASQNTTSIMSGAQFDKEVDRLRKAGQISAARNMESAYAAGKITLKD